MLSLRDLQRDFRRALLGEGGEGIAALIVEDGLTAEHRLDVYRNNVLASLQEVLKDTFPVVCRLVDERFFLYATAAFMRAHPPREVCLVAYGAGFADFLAGFPACAPLVYLADVARLEWLMHEAAHAAQSPALAPPAMSGVTEADMPRLTFTFDPTLGLIESPWPIERIWRANQSGHENEAAIDLGGGGTRLEVRRRAGTVVFRSLDAATFTFRVGLLRGLTLAAATEAALADPGFDLGLAFADLFRDGSVTGFGLASHSGIAGAG